MRLIKPDGTVATMANYAGAFWWNVKGPCQLDVEANLSIVALPTELSDIWKYLKREYQNEEQFKDLMAQVVSALKEQQCSETQIESALKLQCSRAKGLTRCPSCGSSVFSNLHIEVMTEDEFMARERFAYEDKLLPELLRDHGNELPPDSRDAAEQLVKLDEEFLRRNPDPALEMIRQGRTSEFVESYLDGTITAWARDHLTPEQCAKLERAKEELKEAWQQGDFPQLCKVGFEPCPCRFVRMTCTDCGRWNYALPLGQRVPAEWWVDPTVTKPEVVRVEFDPDAMVPLCCILDGVYTEVQKTRKRASTTTGRSPAGKYEVVTDIGDLCLEAIPDQAEDDPHMTTCTWAAQFGSPGAMERWKELRESQSRAPLAASSMAERRIRLSESRPLNERAYQILFQLENRFRHWMCGVLTSAFRDEPTVVWYRREIEPLLRAEVSNRIPDQPTTAMDIFGRLSFGEMRYIIGRLPNVFRETLAERRRLERTLEDLIEVRHIVMHTQEITKARFRGFLTYAEVLQGMLERADVQA